MLTIHYDEPSAVCVEAETDQVVRKRLPVSHWLFELESLSALAGTQSC